MKQHRKSTVLFLIILMGLSAILLFSLFTKKLCLNTFFARKYEIQGVDISHYQGQIDWQTLQKQNIDFAFIKATEGSSHVDACFSQNWASISKTSLYAGAYHFFSFDSPAKTQAQLFIHTVGPLSGKLAPVIDIEYYGNKEKNPPKKDAVLSSLQEFLSILEQQYQIKPILYTTYKVYNKYLKKDFQEYPLWIRNVYYPPVFALGKRWSFWQYSDTAVLTGYKGTEPYIDRNVFRGSLTELKSYLVP